MLCLVERSTDHFGDSSLDAPPVKLALKGPVSNLAPARALIKAHNPKCSSTSFELCVR